MWLALIALSAMMLGTVFLAVFGRSVAALLEAWTRDTRRTTGAPPRWGRGPT